MNLRSSAFDPEPPKHPAPCEVCGEPAVMNGRCEDHLRPEDEDELLRVFNEFLDTMRNL